MDKIINEISNIKVLNLKEYNNLISRYGINDVNLAFKQILNLSTKKQELLKLYSIASIGIDITSQNKRNNRTGRNKNIRYINVPIDKIFRVL